MPQTFVTAGRSPSVSQVRTNGDLIAQALLDTGQAFSGSFLDAQDKIFKAGENKKDRKLALERDALAAENDARLERLRSSLRLEERAGDDAAKAKQSKRQVIESKIQQIDQDAKLGFPFDVNEYTRLVNELNTIDGVPPLGDTGSVESSGRVGAPPQLRASSLLDYAQSERAKADTERERLLAAEEADRRIKTFGQGLEIGSQADVQAQAVVDALLPDAPNDVRSTLALAIEKAQVESKRAAESRQLNADISNSADLATIRNQGIPLPDNVAASVVGGLRPDLTDAQIAEALAMFTQLTGRKFSGSAEDVQFFTPVEKAVRSTPDFAGRKKDPLEEAFAPTGG